MPHSCAWVGSVWFGLVRFGLVWCWLLYQFPVASDLNYTWAPNDKYGTWCAGRTTVEMNGTSAVECTEAFNSFGGLDNCAGGQYAAQRLVVVAQCFDTHLEINGELVEKKTLVELIAVLDCFQMLFVLLAWRFLRRKEIADAHNDDLNTATAADYTVMVRCPHKYNDRAEIETALRAHFKGMLGRDAIADINVGYNNAKSIDTLRLRGRYMVKLDRFISGLRKIRVQENTLRQPGSKRSVPVRCECFEMYLCVRVWNSCGEYALPSSFPDPRRATGVVIREGTVRVRQAVTVQEAVGAFVGRVLRHCCGCGCGCGCGFRAHPHTRTPARCFPSCAVAHTVGSLLLGHSAMPCHAMPCHAMPCHAAPHHTTPHHTTPHHTTPHHTTQKVLNKLKDNLVARAKAKNRHVVVSFITFREHKDQVRVLKQYPQNYWSQKCLCCQRNTLRLENLYPLRVQPAPEPSDIIWENLATSRSGRCWRSFLTSLIAILVLFISAWCGVLLLSPARSSLRAFLRVCVRCKCLTCECVPCRARRLFHHPTHPAPHSSSGHGVHLAVGEAREPPQVPTGGLRHLL